MNALEKLKEKNNNNKFICVGLDSDIKKIPQHLKEKKNPILEFNKEIIEATKDNAAAFKFNFAFYEKDGAEGLKTLKESISFIPKDTLIIGDAKRGDIGNTSQMYAKAIFEYFNCDASTIHPYMGEDSVAPFLDFKNKLNFILALTSNPGAEDFEKLELRDGSFLFQKVIENVKAWNKNNNCGIVFGATKSKELEENIQLFERLPVLLPGIGAQGGSLEEVINIFKNFMPYNFLINISRGIIYKGSGKDFSEDSKKELINYNKRIPKILSE
ncbi:MAG: orotidine-5'-phosphate decarboxylase [Ignavibacteriaceae bacterium]